jgi:hypothetical protein
MVFQYSIAFRLEEKVPSFFGTPVVGLEGGG